MKKILWVLIFALCVPAAYAAQNETGVIGARRQAMVQKYAKKITAEEFLSAVRNGNLTLIGQVQEPALFKAQDKFGNNCFHLAKDAATIQAVAAAARRLDNNYLTLFKTLRDQRNHIGETPLLYHVGLGKADTFEVLYRGSSLQEAVRAANAVSNKGAALVNTANVKQAVVRTEASDQSGRTVADVALANGLEEVVAYFEQHAPYLFTK